MFKSFKHNVKCLNIIAVEVEGMPPLVIKRSLLKQIACNTSADCGDHTCSCSEIGLCVCFISATKELNLNNMQFEDLKQEDLKN